MDDADQIEAVVFERQRIVGFQIEDANIEALRGRDINADDRPSLFCQKDRVPPPAACQIERAAGRNKLRSLRDYAGRFHRTYNTRVSVRGVVRHLTSSLRGGPTMLKVGDPAPDFEATDDRGRRVKLSDFRGKKVVLWFFPKASTPG